MPISPTVDFLSAWRTLRAIVVAVVVVKFVSVHCPCGRRRRLDVPVIVKGVDMWIVIGERVVSSSGSSSYSKEVECWCCSGWKE